MRIWHEKLIPKLCQKHLCAMWREGLGCYKIITENMQVSYAKHPATLEFIDRPQSLWHRLEKVREEMIGRGYHPKELPVEMSFGNTFGKIKEWQTLEEQIEVLKTKNCKCRI